VGDTTIEELLELLGEGLSLERLLPGHALLEMLRDDVAARADLLMNPVDRFLGRGIWEGREAHRELPRRWPEEQRALLAVRQERQADADYGHARDPDPRARASGLSLRTDQPELGPPFRHLGLEPRHREFEFEPGRGPALLPGLHRLGSRLSEVSSGALRRQPEVGD